MKQFTSMRMCRQVSSNDCIFHVWGHSAVGLISRYFQCWKKIHDWTVMIMMMMMMPMIFSSRLESHTGIMSCCAVDFCRLELMFSALLAGLGEILFMGFCLLWMGGWVTAYFRL
jgi:hypothetical protein